MSVLLFSMICRCSDTSHVVYFKAYLYEYMLIDHCYVDYYLRYGDYGINVFMPLRGQGLKCIWHFFHSVLPRKSNALYHLGRK